MSYDLERIISGRLAGEVYVFEKPLVTRGNVDMYQSGETELTKTRHSGISIGILYAVLQQSKSALQLHSYGVASMGDNRFVGVLNSQWIPREGAFVFDADWILKQVDPITPETWVYNPKSKGMAFQTYEFTGLPYSDASVIQSQENLMAALQSLQDSSSSLMVILGESGSVPRGVIGELAHLNAGSLQSVGRAVELAVARLDRQILGHRFTMVYSSKFHLREA